MNPRERIEYLTKLINHHNRKYYVENSPEVTDAEYDRLLKELRDLEHEYPEHKAADSPAQRLGDSPVEVFDKVTHRIPMLSIDNCYSYEELKEFDARVKKLLGDVSCSYTAELKIDGIAVSLWYESGILARGITRGNGITGDDITHNIKTVRSIPLSLKSIPEMPVPPFLDVRGEIFMTGTTLEKLNRERERNGNPLFINTRNAAGGSLKLLDSRITAERELRAFIHSAGNTEYFSGNTGHYEALQVFRKLGLPVNEHTRKCADIEEVIGYCNEWETKRKNLEYEIDGIVVKVDGFSHRSALGTTAKYPRWLIAYKYKAEQKQTVLRNIHIQVGKTGVLTPVAELEPVFISGSTVSKASLHNIEEIFARDIRIGDTVVVEKAGEIIPQVVTSLPELRDGSETEMQYPSECPVCGTPVHKDEEGIYIRCVNIKCPAQVKANILYYGSPEAMNIEGLGTALVDQLYETGLVRSIADIYDLSEEKVAELDRMGPLSAQNLIREIHRSKEMGLARVLTAVGIRHIGKTSAGVLAHHFGSIENIAGAEEEDLAAVDGIGPVLASSIVDFFRNPVNREIITRLKQAGVVMEAVNRETGGSRLEGKRFVFTGTLSGMTRKQAQEAVRDLGGIPVSAVSGSTDFLVAGPGGGSKLKKAERLGVPVIDENEFRRLINQ